jgi:cell division protein FtsN
MSEEEINEVENPEAETEPEIEKNEIESDMKKEEIHKKEDEVEARISPAFWLAVAAFVIVTAAGAYYFLLREKYPLNIDIFKSKKIITKTAAVSEIKPEVVERDYEIPVSVAVKEIKKKSTLPDEQKDSVVTSPPVKKESQEVKKMLTEKAKQVDLRAEKASMPAKKISEIKKDKLKPVEEKTKKIKTADKQKEVAKTAVNEKLAEKPKSEKKKKIVKNDAQVKENSKEKTISPYIYSSGGKYVVQVSSWTAKELALGEAKKLIKSGYKAFVVASNVNGKIWYRVRIGEYSTIQQAREVEKVIK